ncbi:MAG: YbaB/EbfC family nucleoid-associated protein [Acidimicrobiales bacterium]|nr:YbaB/EbfC family nucleoid-associated protein [Acidimicrobiales bacterium]
MNDEDQNDDGNDDDHLPTASGPSLPAEVAPPSAVPAGADDDPDGSPFDLGNLLGGGGLDLGNLIEQAGEMQRQLAAAQDEAAATEVEGAAGGGAVRIVVTGAGEFRSVSIDPAAVDPDEVGMLEDLVLAALHDASARIAEMQERSMGGLGGLLGGA